MKAVFFDLDDTLYSRKFPFVEAFCYFDKKSGNKMNLTLLHKEFVQSGNEVFDDSATGKITPEEMYIYRFLKATAKYGLSYTEKEALEFQQLYDEKMGEICLSHTIGDMLSYLQEKEIPMGIITNGESEHQKKKLRALKIDRWIDEKFWFISEDYVPKPDGTMFLEAEKSLGLIKNSNDKRKELWYAGDSYERDIQSAAGLGWNTIWLNLNGEKIISEREEHHLEVFSEEELNRAIKKKF